MKKATALAALFTMSLSGATLAQPFFLDLGADYGSDTNEAAPCPSGAGNCTSVKTEFQYKYQSTSVITDTDVNGIDNGDAITTSAGLAVGGYAANAFTALTPSQSLGGANTDNGLNTSWKISFQSSNLMGTVTIDGGGNIIPIYTSGLIEFMITFDEITSINFMDLNVTGTTTNGLGTFLVGNIDFTNVDPTYNNLFNIAGSSCAAGSGFFDIWSNCIPPEISLLADFNTNATAAAFTPIGNNQFQITGSNHDGSGVVQHIPEPGTLALIGLGLLGVAGLRRKQH